jgi:hypothetical protein
VGQLLSFFAFFLLFFFDFLDLDLDSSSGLSIYCRMTLGRPGLLSISPGSLGLTLGLNLGINLGLLWDYFGITLGLLRGLLWAYSGASLLITIITPSSP